MLAALTRREYSAEELRRKLLSYDEDNSDELEALLAEFKQRGWISDARYADQMVHARRSKYGSLKLAHELRANGVADELVSKAVTEMQTSELDTARKLWQKKFGVPPQGREDWAKQARFLQGRGFGLDVIKRVISNKEED
jgi:regulatory protein